MAIPQGKVNHHWNYFLALEQDLGRLSRFIEFSEDNYPTYSIELAHLLLATCSEVDVVLKAVCDNVGNSKKHYSMGEYKKIILSKCPELMGIHCQIPKFSLPTISPWQNLNDEIVLKTGKKIPKSPLWWDAYNDVKHDRGVNFHQANLKNVINAVSALYIVTFYYHHLDEYQSQELFLMNPLCKTLSNRETSLIKLITLFPDVG